MISTKYPAYHPKAGQDTYFEIKLQNGIKGYASDMLLYYDKDFNIVSERKIHTIRTNYTLWSERIKEVQAGKAVLSIRTWSGQPYKSKQREIALITKENHPGVEFVVFGKETAEVSKKVSYLKSYSVSLEELAKNDGLTLADFQDWFKNSVFGGAIIHFTNFRYIN